MQLDAVLFDLGHTLVDFTAAEDAMHDTYRSMADLLVAALEIEHPEGVRAIEAVRSHLDSVVEASYRRGALDEVDIAFEFDHGLRNAGYELDGELLESLIEADHAAFSDSIAMPPETLEILEALRGHGYRLALVSNAHFLPRLIGRDIERLGIAELLEVAVFSSGVGRRKPDPLIYEAALAPLGVSPERAAFVGDRVREDVTGPQSLGMKGILTTQFREDEGDHSRADCVIANLRELPERLGALTGAQS